MRECNDADTSVEYELIDLGFDTQVTCNFNHQQQNKYIHFSLTLNKQSQVKFDSVANGEIPQYNQFKLHKQRARTFTIFFLHILHIFFASTRLRFINFSLFIMWQEFFFLFSFIVSAQVFDRNTLDYTIKIVRIILSFAHVFFINHISLLHSLKKLFLSADSRRICGFIQAFSACLFNLPHL